MKLRNGFSNLVDVLGAIIFSVITLVCFAQIIDRYVFGKSLVFAEEMAVELMIWIAFLGAAKCILVDAHTRMSVVVNMLPARFRTAMTILSNLLCIGFLAVATWYGFRLVGSTWRGTTTGTHIPEGLVYLAMPFSSIIMIVLLVLNSIDTLRGVETVHLDVEQ
jgi:C4-dicarboxylate transporter DctQ subunit